MMMDGKFFSPIMHLLTFFIAAHDVSSLHE
ncbi:MAG: hypothetical protein RLZZ628_2611, partial [Bacteroidota bacterium]